LEVEKKKITSLRQKLGRRKVKGGRRLIPPVVTRKHCKIVINRTQEKKLPLRASLEVGYISKTMDCQHGFRGKSGHSGEGVRHGGVFRKGDG